MQKIIEKENSIFKEYYFSIEDVNTAYLNKYSNLNIFVSSVAPSIDTIPRSKVRDLREDLRKQTLEGGFSKIKLTVLNSKGIIKGKNLKYVIGDNLSIEFWENSEAHENSKIIVMKGKLSSINFDGERKFEFIRGRRLLTSSDIRKVLYLTDVVWSKKENPLKN